MAKRVTIYHIAEKLNISPSTVSRALADNVNVHVETREKVMETAVKMGYVLPKTRTNAHTIAIIVPEINNYFYSQVLSAIQHTIHPNLLVSILCSFNSIQVEREMVAQLDPSQIRCLIISQSMDANDSSHLKEVERKGIPVVLFNRLNYNHVAPKFVIDNYMDSFMLTNHLITSGFKKVAFAAKHYHCPIYKERVQAYKDVLDKYDITFNPDYLIYSELTLEDTYEVINRFINLKNRPDALILPNFVSALQAISIAKIYNISVPSEMAIVSFDETPESKYSTPTITGIERPCIEIGKEIGKFVLSICEDSSYDRDTMKIFRSNLIIRGSSLSNLTSPDFKD